MLARKLLNAARPPAEAPIPTINGCPTSAPVRQT
jgi:hypothetical protein